MPGRIEEFRDGAIGVTVDHDGSSFILVRAEDPGTELARTPDAHAAAETVAWTLLNYARDLAAVEQTDFAYLAEDILLHLDDYAALLEGRREAAESQS
jgi:hypothetical protein